MLAMVHSNLGNVAFIPHGHCYLWKPELVWLHALSDGFIALAYFSIPVALIYFIRHRRDLPYPWIFQLFGTFIVACGLTHTMEIWTLWHPTYWVSGVLKAFTAIVSLATASALFSVIPQALTLPSRGELEAAKAELEQKVRDRTQSLRSSEERLQLAIEGSGDGLWDWNISTGEVFLSPRWQEMLGYEAGELPGHISTWETLIHPEDEPWVMELLSSHMQDAQLPYTFDYRLRTKTGAWKWIGCYGKVVAYDTQGQATRMAGTHKDTSDRKAAETALAESQQRYQDLIENSPDIIERFDLQLRHLYVSPVLTDITGITTDIFLGKTCRDLGMDEGMVKTWEAAAATLVKTRQRQVIEFTLPTLKGLRSFEMAIAPEFSEVFDSSDQQTVKSILCISRDITERKVAEATLRQQDQQIANILSSIEGIVWSCNAETLEFLYLSPTVERIYGRSVSDFLLDPNLWFEMVHPSDQALVAARLGKPPQTGSEILDYRIVTADGQIRWLHHQSHLVYDLTGQPCRIDGIATEITALKAIQESLHVSEERLRLALKAANQGLYDLNISTGAAIVSPEYATMLGYDPATLQETNAKWIERLHPDDRELVANTYNDYVQGKIPDYTVEFRQLTFNGDWRWIHSVGKIVAWDEAGNPLRMLGTHTNITDRKQAEAERLQAEKLRLEFTLLETLLDSVLAGYWDANFSRHFNYWSPGMKRMFGYAEHELADVPEIWKHLIFPEDLPGVLDCLDRHVQSRGEVPYYNEVRYRHKDGSTIWVICVGQVIEWDASGQPLRMIGCHVDITTRKEAEAQLQVLSDRLKLALQAGAIGTWDWDLMNEIVWDERMYEIYGLQQLNRTTVYQDWAARLHPDDLEPAETALQAAIRGEGDYDMEFRIWRTDGKPRWVRSTALVQRNKQGEALRMIGINYDITDRKQSEAKLLQTQAQLETSNQELEAFAYSVSHDLRSPLRAIDGFSKALLEDYGDQFDDEGKNYFERIRHNIQRMGMLIDDLLRLSRVSRSEMRYSAVNLSVLVQEQIKELQASEPERQVEFIVAPEAIVSADLTLMRVVISNLLENAWKFTSHHATAQIEFGIIKQDEQSIYFVRDDGAGFDMAYSAMLFGVFQRLHNTNEFPGTGIGLATVQRAMYRHSGQIWAEAAVEQGATIYFRIHS